MMLAVVAAVLVTADPCVKPGKCDAPVTDYQIVLPMKPRVQWGSSGGFCGSLSIQSAGLMYGNYISQDKVRKACSHGEGHGNPKEGYEILPTNIEEALTNLAFTYESFDYNQTKPQIGAYKKFLKKHLVKGHPVVWFVMCKGDGSQVPYPGSNPNGGHFSHIEPVWGIYSNHSLEDPTVYPDDWLVHGSDWDSNGYHRRFDSLGDTPAMDGNCKHAIPRVGENEAYPCIDTEVNYGNAVTGNVDPKGILIPAVLSVSQNSEPPIRSGRPPVNFDATLEMNHLTTAATYIVYRFEGRETVPRNSVFDTGFKYKHTFKASTTTVSWKDPHPILSSSSVFYRVVRK